MNSNATPDWFAFLPKVAFLPHIMTGIAVSKADNDYNSDYNNPNNHNYYGYDDDDDDWVDPYDPKEPRNDLYWQRRGYLWRPDNWEDLL